MGSQQAVDGKPLESVPTKRSALQMLALLVVFAVTLVARAGKAVSDGTPLVWGRWPGTKAACTLENGLPCRPRTHSPGLPAWGSLFKIRKPLGL